MEYNQQLEKKVPNDFIKAIKTDNHIFNAEVTRYQVDKIAKLIVEKYKTRGDKILNLINT